MTSTTCPVFTRGSWCSWQQRIDKQSFDLGFKLRVIIISKKRTKEAAGREFDVAS